MHVVQLGFQLDAQQRSPEDLLTAWWSLVEIAEAAASAGIRVTVIQACRSTAHLRRNDIDYYFVQPSGSPAALVKAAGFVQLLQRLAPDLVHVHGLVFPDSVVATSRMLPGTAIFIQDHASRVPRPWHWLSWRRGLSVANGISFCAESQANPFIKARLISPHLRVFEIPECSTRFKSGNRTTARQQFSMNGAPTLLWVGHLDANKDPLTVLEGVRRAARHLPEIELWCCFGSAPLLPIIERQLENEPSLKTRVHLLGRVSHATVEQLMHAADAFVSASHREGSGYSLIEAIACGLTPLVTDIPSFRALTANGRIGKLWPCDDAAALSEAILSLPSLSDRQSVLAHFERELSLRALGRKFAAAYEQTIRAATAHEVARA